MCPARNSSIMSWEAFGHLVVVASNILGSTMASYTGRRYISIWLRDCQAW